MQTTFSLGRARLIPLLLILLAALVVVIAISGVADPSVGSDFLQGAQVDGAVRGILGRACRDCHSEDTRYPWYTFVPVVNDWIRTDVSRGREQLNLSRWSDYPRVRRVRALTGIANQVKDRAMPPQNYLALHPAAKLSQADVDAVFAWTQTERMRLIQEGLAERDVVK